MSVFFPPSVLNSYTENEKQSETFKGGGQRQTCTF